MDNYIVRPARPEDDASVKIVDALSTATLRETYRPNQAALDNRAMLSARLNCLVAADGMLIAGTVQWYMENETVRILGLGVHPDFRQQGIARGLLAHLETLAQKQGAVRLRLYTVKETGNADIFVRLGFHVIAECEDKFSESDKFPKLTEVEMEKRLIELIFNE